MRRPGDILRRALGAAAIAATVALVPSGVVAQSMAVPVDMQFSLFYRILTYRRLATLATNNLVICVPYQGRFRASTVAKNEVIQQRPPVGAGYAVQFVPIDLDGPDELRTAARTADCDLVYVTPLRATRVELIAELCGDLGILTLTGVPEYVDHGVAVAIGVNDDRPEIVVNLAAATAQGTQFSAQLLRVARVR